ncbi:NYN domain-containing protein [Myxosarcina sp. GI1(2024)]
MRELNYRVICLPKVARPDGTVKNIGDELKICIDILNEVKPGDRLILISGDGDFYPVIEEIKQRNVELTVVASQDSVRNRLQFLADKFVEIDTIQNSIASKVNLYAA